MTGNNRSLQKPPFWATFFTIIGALILCSLGTWQFQRGAWKTEILSKLNRAYDGAAAQSQDLFAQNFTDGAFLYGRVEGRFLADKALFVGPRTKGEEIGFHLLVPLETQTGTLFVNLGFANSQKRVQAIRHLNNQTLWFEGLARAPDWNSFTPDNLPEEDVWYKLDLEEIAAAKNLPPPLPYILYAERSSERFKQGAPDRIPTDMFPNNERWYPPNNHGQYTLFWFAMAGVLIVIYGLRFLRKPEE